MTLADIREFLIPEGERDSLTSQAFLEQLVLKQQFLIDNGYLSPKALFGGMDSGRLEEIFGRSLPRQQSLEQFKAPPAPPPVASLALAKSSDLQNVISQINHSALKRPKPSSAKPSSGLYAKAMPKKVTQNYFKQEQYSSHPDA